MTSSGDRLNNGQVEPTRRELYAQAQDADIKGPSGMSKGQLEDALEG
jgi:hypothetical protein